jgi:hypothetical protein
MSTMRARPVSSIQQGGDAMTEPATHRPSHGNTLEKSVEDLLAAARPLPPADEMVIKELTEDEERRFFEAIRNA